MFGVKKYLYRLLVLITIVGIGWRVYVLGYSDVLVGSFAETKGVEVYKKSYSLDDRNLGAVFKLATDHHSKGEYEASNSYLLEALNIDPSYGRATGLLLSNFSKLRSEKQAQRVAYFSSKLWPAHSYVRSHLLDYWLLQDNKPKIFEELNVLLTRNPNLRKSIYPTLDIWAKGDQLKLLFSPYILSPPKWWDSYFSHLSYQKNNLSELEYFYHERLKSNVSLSEYEIKLMTRRLIREKKWAEAHQVWLNGLPSNIKKYNKILFDGGFESGLHNDPFSWRLSKSKIFKADIASSYGIKGRKALHLKFKRKKQINFRHIVQKTVIPSGKYTLNMKVRIDSTIGEKGLKWRLRCVGKRSSIIGETESFTVRKSWHDIVTPIEVPQDDCEAQELRLEATSEYAHYQVFSGSLWFDDIKIESREESND